jgi:transposase
MPFCAGVDWGGDAHALCVLDAAGGIVLTLKPLHTAAGLADMLAQLRKLAPPAQITVALERPTGVIVDALIQAGHPVVPIHPNVVRACRSRYGAGRGKSDPGDAYMIADILRTDGHRLRPLAPLSDDIRALRAMVRAREDMVANRVGLANQLRALLEGFWPGAASIFADVDSPISLAFLRKYPTPGSARLLAERRLANFLKAEGYSGRRSAAELLARLRAAPACLVGAAEAAASGRIVTALVANLNCLLAQLAHLTAEVQRTVEALADGQLVMSFPRAGRICAAAMLAEIGDVRARFQTEAQLAAEAGVCPVTHASGKRRGVVFRFACNQRLRAAVTCFADNSRHASAWAADIYHRARTRGCQHPHAVRILARAWIRILWRAWTDRKTYDPTKHKNRPALPNPAPG